jgi:deazaflavin-dependent oxidoreductase (nitroreductase family)
MPLHGEYLPSSFSYSAEQAATIEASGGTQGADFRGLPVVVLTSVGARSGALRKNVLMRVEHDGQYAVVGSRRGLPKNPDWVYNLRKRPHVELQDGPDKQDYSARELTGPERDVWWDRAVSAFPDYAEYQTRTTRSIPVFLLSCIES